VLGVESEHAALQPERLDQRGDRRNLVALFLHYHVAEHDPVGMTKSRQHVRRLLVGEGVETAAQRLPIDGDRRHARRRNHNRPGVRPKGSLQRAGVDALKDVAQAGVGWRAAQLQTERLVQLLAMKANELTNLQV